MNGDVNGTMAESMDANLSSTSPDPSNVFSEDCDDNKKDCEKNNKADSCNLSDSQSVNGTVDNGMTEHSDNENISDQPYNEGSSLINPEKLTQEITNNSMTRSPCENGNKSEPEATDSSQENSKKSDLEQSNQISEDGKGNMSLKQNGSVKVTDQGSVHGDDTDDDSMAEQESANSREVRAEGTIYSNKLEIFTFDSDSDSSDADETSQESQSENKSNDVIVLDGENRSDINKSEVHEINSDDENDDCVIAGEDKTDSNGPDENIQLRRSSRAIKRKRYADEIDNENESDIEEVQPVHPLKRKSEPVTVYDAKALVTMATRQTKVDQDNLKKKDFSALIMESSLSSNKLTLSQNKTTVSSNNAVNAQSLYQSIIARGTSVTPVSIKNNNTSTTTATQNQHPAILPSLTDDMFVVEAPSFIVPYVYEKPSVTAFREFVDKLGRQLEQERIKEEIKEKEKREKEKEERREKGEHVDSDDPEAVDNLDKSEDNNEDQENKRKKSKKDKKRMNMEDDASWDGESAESGESASEFDDEVLSDDNDKIVVKGKFEPINQISDVAELTADKICSNKAIGKSSMDCSLGKFFINIGLNLVQEYVQSDLLKQQNRKLNKEKKSGQSTKATESSIAQLMKNLEFSKENNAPYNFPQKKCELCSFKSESILVMAHHLETPHMKNNVYKCNFCTYEIRSPHDILYHMESVHKIRGRLERAPSVHQCVNCPFEDNGKGKLARHLIACAKKFKPETNLAPPVDWEPPAKIPKIARPRNNAMSPYQTAFHRSAMGTPIRGSVNMGTISGGSPGFRPRGRSPMAVPPRAQPYGLPIMRPPIARANNAAALNMSNNFTIGNINKPKSSHQPSISITPLPRQPAPIPVAQPTNVANNKNSFVICEICDGYIKDLEQLRNHMQWIHKVKIHPKMIHNRPPLNCQKCQFRFFTDQGFERHLLGAHGLVTSSMQEAANKGKDAGRCPVCGRVYQWKLLNHVARDHNLTLKPGHLSYKCTVCTATFGMYKQFENHVYSAHSVVAKRVMDKNKTAAQSTKGNNDTLLKPLKINEEITITPQSVKSTKLAKDK